LLGHLQDTKPSLLWFFTLTALGFPFLSNKRSLFVPENKSLVVFDQKCFYRSEKIKPEKGINTELYICLINGPAFSRLPEQPGDILEYRKDAKRDE
jgi:hypothetical protein